jgi:ATP-binding cassette subfamily B protein
MEKANNGSQKDSRKKKKSFFADEKRASLKDVKKSVSFMYQCAREYSNKYMLIFWLEIIFSVITPLLMLVIPSVAVHFISEDPNLKMLFISLCGLFLVYLICNSVQIYCSNMRNWSSTFVRISKCFSKVYDKSLSCDYIYYEGAKAKEERRKASRALDSNWIGGELILKQVPATMIDVLNLIVYICISSFVSYQIALILLGMVISNIILGYIANGVYDNYVDSNDKCQTKTQYYYQTAKNELKAKDIRNYKLANMFSVALKKQYTLSNHYSRIQRFVFILPNLSDTIFGYVRDFIAYSIMIKQVIDGTLSVSQFTLMISVVNGLSTYLTEIATKIYDIFTASKDLSYTIKYIEAEDTQNHSKGIDLKSLTIPFTVEFKDVSFTYPDAEKPIISNLSFKVKAGEKIALVGENGAGKTTIIKLLSGLYRPTSGSILIDGHDIKEFNTQDYFSLLSVINQDIQVIGLSLKSNITCTNNEELIDKEKYSKAIEESGLSEKIESLPQKDNTYLTQNLNPNGILLSGGETQKLMLARALYKNGALLMLDEPTSALDPIAEGELYRQYSNLTKGKTSLFVSHRLSSTRFCDRILYLKDGKILEEGTHEELMKKKGEYFKVFEVQAHYYKEGGKQNENAI